MSINHLISLLPESSLNVIIQAGSDLSRSKWIAGDQNNYLCAYVREHSLCDEKGVPYTMADVNRVVGSLFGVRARRVRDYAAVCKRFSLSEREEYDVLPFSHFEFAMRYPDLTTDILECSKRAIDDFHRPPSVEWLEYSFHDAIRAYQAQTAQLEGVTVYESVVEQAKPVDDDPLEYLEQGPDNNQDMGYALGVLKQGIATMLRLVDRLILPRDVKRRVVDLLDQVERELSNVESYPMGCLPG